MKLDNGEHGLLFISHEGGSGDQVEGIAQYNYKQIFLRLAAKKHIKPWLTDGLFEPRLAFNMCCYFAKQNRYTDMVGAIKTAMELGKPAEQFIEDDDFAPLSVAA